MSTRKGARKTLPQSEWYTASQAAIERHYGPQADLFTLCLACTSANATVRSNVTLAQKAFAQVNATGLRRETFIKGHFSSLVKALEHGEPQSRKLQAFYRALRGDKNAVVVDIWMVRWHTGNLRFDGSPTVRLHREIEARVRREAAAAGVSPRDYQAYIWETLRGNGETYADILSRKGQQLALEIA